MSQLHRITLQISIHVLPVLWRALTGTVKEPGRSQKWCSVKSEGSTKPLQSMAGSGVASHRGDPEPSPEGQLPPCLGTSGFQGEGFFAPPRALRGAPQRRVHIVPFTDRFQLLRPSRVAHVGFYLALDMRGRRPAYPSPLFECAK